MKLAYPSRKNSLLRSAVVPDEAVSRTGRVASHGLTLMELLVATGLGSLMAAIIFTLTLYGERSFAVMANCADLDSKSRNALDVMSREIRQATQVTAVVTNFPLKWLTLTNADRGSKLTLTWDAEKRTLDMETGGRTQNLLGDCDQWDFTLFNDAPNVSATNVTFNLAAKLSECKLITMSWSCSRSVLRKIKTDSVQGIQIALRNK